MTELVTESTRILQTLDWHHQPPCEMEWGIPEVSRRACDEEAGMWLTYVNNAGCTARRLSCVGCVGRVVRQGRLIEVRAI